MQASQGLQGLTADGTQLIPAEVKQGQGGEPCQGLVLQQLNAVFLQVQLLQSLE